MRRSSGRRRPSATGRPAPGVDLLDPATHVGALISDSHIQKVLGYIALGQAEGATLLSGGKQVTERAMAHGNFVQGRGALRRELTACLRTGRTLRTPRARVGLRGKSLVSSDIMISQRPALVAVRNLLALPHSQRV